MTFDTFFVDVGIIVAWRGTTSLVSVIYFRFRNIPYYIPYYYYRRFS